MLSSLFEDIRKTVAGEGDKKAAYIRELGVHKKKIGDEIAKNDTELAKLEKEEKSKITSEGLHEGFSSSVPPQLRRSTYHSMSLNRLRNRPSLAPRTININQNRKFRPWRSSILRRRFNRIR